MYEDMEKICEENRFWIDFGMWDIIEQYAISGRKLKHLPDDFQRIFELYKEVVLNYS